jgi:hypothetical protein
MTISLSVKAARRIRKVALVVFWFCAFVLMLLGQAEASLFDPIILVYATAFSLLGLLAVAAYIAALKLGQMRKALEYERALREALSGDPVCSVILFLRSFTVAKASLTSRVARSLIHLLEAFLARAGDKHIDPYNAEEELDDAISGNAIFVAIGDKHESYGSFKLIVPDEEWQETFFRLAGLAKLIVMMPGASTSTLWEISEILSSPVYLEKSVFIMPRASDYTFSAKEAASWASLVDVAAKELGARLPAYRKDGCYFRLGKDGLLSGTAGLEAFTRGIRKYLARQEGLDDFNIADIWKAAQ